MYLWTHFNFGILIGYYCLIIPAKVAEFNSNHSAFCHRYHDFCIHFVVHYQSCRSRFIRNDTLFLNIIIFMLQFILHFTKHLVFIYIINECVCSYLDIFFT